MTPEERKAIMAYWKDRPDVPFDVLEEFSDALDARDALLRRIDHWHDWGPDGEETDSDWIAETRRQIRAVLGEKP